MQIKLFTIPAFGSADANEEMNKFLRSQRVLEVHQEFVSIENGAYWCFSIKFLQSNGLKAIAEKKEKIDYRNVLEESVFKLFSKLREYRKEIANKDAVPAYAVFTDAELAEISKMSEISIESIQKIKGIGSKRTEKYGKLIIEMYQNNEKDWQTDK